MSQKRKRCFDYFEVGTTPPNSGVIILEQLELTPQRLTTQYKVRYLCCNTTITMAHKSIAIRQNRDTKECRRCTARLAVKAIADTRRSNSRIRYSRAKTQAELLADYGVTPPTWPVPNHQLIGKHLLWCDRMTQEQS